MYISLLHASENTPWTLTSKLCDRRVCFVKFTSANKIDFNPTLIDFLAINGGDTRPGGSDIRNCISFSITAKNIYHTHLAEINEDLKFLNPQNVFTDINHNQTIDHNGMDYEWNSFVVVSKGDYEHSATRVRCALYIPVIFPYFRAPYVILAAHPKTPFFEWKTPGLECLFVEIDCYLKNTAANAKVRVIGRQVSNEIRANLHMYIRRCHRERNHPEIRPEPSLPDALIRNNQLIAKLRRKNMHNARNQGNFELFSEWNELDPITALSKRQIWPLGCHGLPATQFR